ncbi:MAG: aldo/keto reductase [Flavobacterium sp.]|nr:aldo/keto reductase [Flavobacterium sp.]
MYNILLNNGLEMPVFGLGTFPMKRFELFMAVYYALKSGYTCFDTASAYSNEAWLGFSLKFWRLFGLGKNVFLTTKLSNIEQRTMEVEDALIKSMNRLGVKELDLYLMHWPNPETFVESWGKMEKLYKKGLVKAIGVCNFHQHHLETLMKSASVVPVVNQIELHPLLSQEPLRKFCKGNGIAVEAYSPVARMNPRLIENKVLVKIAQNYRKTVPQVIFRWDLQHGLITIPKSSSQARIKGNIEIFDFELSQSEMCEIDSLNEDFRVRYNPDTADLTKL